MQPDAFDELPPLDRLRHAPAPPVSRVRDRVRTRRNLRWGALATLPAVLTVAAVGLQQYAEPGSRDRGTGVGVVHAALSAVIEGGGPARPFVPGGDVAADERLVFSVRTDSAVVVNLREVSASGSHVIWPTSGSWWVDGEGFVGGTEPLAWRPDGAGGTLRYELLACPDEGALASGEGCARDALTVRWNP